MVIRINSLVIGFVIGDNGFAIIIIENIEGFYYMLFRSNCQS